MEFEIISLFSKGRDINERDLHAPEATSNFKGLLDTNPQA